MKNLKNIIDYELILNQYHAERERVRKAKAQKEAKRQKHYNKKRGLDYV